MEAYKCVYRDPRSPLTPLAPMSSKQFTFSTTPVTSASRSQKSLVPSTVKTRSTHGGYLTVESESKSLVPSTVKTRSTHGGLLTVESESKQRIVISDANGEVYGCISRTSSTKQVYKTDSVLGKYHLSPHSTRKLTAAPTQGLRACNAVKVFLPATSPCVPQSISPRVKRILKQTGMSKYEPLFEAEEIDYEIFKSLSDDDLVELGIKCSRDRDVIMKAVRYWSHFH